MAGKEIIYWDACAFLALIKDEQGHPFGEMEALKQQASDFDQGVIYIASSTITVLEVLSADLTSEQRERFESALQRSNFVSVEASESVMRMAADIRRHYYKKVFDGDGKPLIVGSPDAIHIASAVTIGASELVTFDSKNKPKQREMGMTQIGTLGPILGRHTLLIRRPAFGTNTTLFGSGNG